MSPSLTTPRLERRRIARAGRHAALGLSGALGGMLSASAVAPAALALPGTLPVPSSPTTVVPQVLVPGVPTIPGVPAVPSVPGSTEAPSLTTLEQLLASAAAGTGSGAGGATGSGGGSGSGSHTSASGSGFVLSASSAAVPVFKVLSMSVTKSGRIVDTVALPSPALLVVRATARRPAPKGSRPGTRATHGGRRVGATLAKFSMHAPAGIAVIVLDPKLPKSRTKLVVATTYAPHGAVATTITRSVEVPRAASSRRKHH